jgi:hypothetical protein
MLQATPDDAGSGKDAADRSAGFFSTWDDHAYVEWAFDEDVLITKIKFWLEHKLFPCYYRWQGVRRAWEPLGESAIWAVEVAFLTCMAQVTASGQRTYITGAGTNGDGVMTGPIAELQGEDIGNTPGTSTITIPNTNYYRKYRFEKWYGGSAAGVNGEQCGSPSIYEVEFPDIVYNTRAPTATKPVVLPPMTVSPSPAIVQTLPPTPLPPPPSPAPLLPIITLSPTTAIVQTLPPTLTLHLPTLTLPPTLLPIITLSPTTPGLTPLLPITFSPTPAIDQTVPPRATTIHVFPSP